MHGNLHLWNHVNLLLTIFDIQLPVKHAIYFSLFDLYLV